MGVTKPLELTRKVRKALEALLARPTSPSGLARRARVVLLSADGVFRVEIARRLGLTQERVSRVRQRFIESGFEGLADRPKAGRKDHAVPQATIERIVELAMSPPPAGRTRWTTRLLAREVGHASGTVSGVLRANGLKPHLSRTYKVSMDPEFAEKVRDVVGLYLNPPSNAVVLSVDEKTQIQALERTQLPLPLRTGRASRHTHDYKRHGVLDLYAALEVATGKVTHQCTERHTAIEFLAFMKKVARTYPRRELHVILDNSSTHSTPEVIDWLARHVVGRWCRLVGRRRSGWRTMWPTTGSGWSSCRRRRGGRPPVSGCGRTGICGWTCGRRSPGAAI